MAGRKTGSGDWAHDSMREGEAGIPRVAGRPMVRQAGQGSGRKRDTCRMEGRILGGGGVGQQDGGGREQRWSRGEVLRARVGSCRVLG